MQFDVRLSTLGAMNGTRTADMEVLLSLPPLDLFIMGGKSGGLRNAAWVTGDTIGLVNSNN